MKHKARHILGACLLAGVVLVFSSCRSGFYAINAIDRSINDPPSGIFLFEDDWVRIETGKHRLVSYGGNGDNDTYRHFVRSLWHDRDGLDFHHVSFQPDPYWDDYYLFVKYKTAKHRTVPALESVLGFLYPDGQIQYEEQAGGGIQVTAPPVHGGQ